MQRRHDEMQGPEGSPLATVKPPAAAPLPRPAFGPLDASRVLALQRSVGNARVASLLQPRAAGPPLVLRENGHGGSGATATASPGVLTEVQARSAVEWASTRVGEEAVRELQGALGMDPTGTYDEPTAQAVAAKQRDLRMRRNGRADPRFFARLGLISTRTITAATVGDAELGEIQQRFPDGVTVAIYANYDDTGASRSKRVSNAEFRSQAALFARNQRAVGLAGGAARVGVACPLTEVGQIIEIVQSIHRGLLARAQQDNDAGEAAAEGDAPAWAKVKTLALFSHGVGQGMGMNANNRFAGGGLTSRDRGIYPSNIEALVRGLRGAVTADVGVQLFACLTGTESTRSAYEEWTGHAEGDRAGGGSFAAQLAEELGPEASVFAHTTAGHTTENFAARGFGAVAGGGAGGLHMFEILYDAAFIASELTRLFPDKTDDERAELRTPLREQMWAHYKDAISGEHNRSASAKRFSSPIGQEMFANPENARTMLRADWVTWVRGRMDRIQPPRQRRRRRR